MESLAFSRLLFATIVLASVAFLIWSWRRLWRSGDDPYTMAVYVWGVQRIGGGAGLALSVERVLASAHGGVLAYLAAAAFFAPWLLAISLWTGYAIGRFMAWFYDLHPPLDRDAAG